MPKPRGSRPVSLARPRITLDADQIQAVRALRRQGVRAGLIAERLGVPVRLVYTIRCGSVKGR